MTIRILLRYFIGDRAAILTLAAHPRAWVIGLIFVLSAGFAREYDGEDLLDEPWYLFLPLAASLVSSFFLFFILYGAKALSVAKGPSFFRAYRSFLGLFWLTAPLAWLYAVPYERLLDPVPATHANLITLALVSAWRVALMVRVAIVLFGMSPAAAFFRTMAYADGAALVALLFAPFPIIEIMGGVHLTEAEAIARNAAQSVFCWGSLSFLVWLVVALATIGTESSWRLDAQGSSINPKVSWPLKVLTFSSLAIWTILLPFTQPEQQLRHGVESAFRAGRYADALALMSAHLPDDFPPHWDPPPRFLKGERAWLVLDIWEEILRNNPAPWVRQYYLAKLKTYLLSNRFDVDHEKAAEVINHLPEGKMFLLDLGEAPNAQWILERLDPHLQPDLRRTK